MWEPASTACLGGNGSDGLEVAIGSTSMSSPEKEKLNVDILIVDKGWTREFLLGEVEG